MRRDDMVKSLEKMVLEFTVQVKEKFADYVALYISFIEYVKEEYSDYEYSLEQFLNHDLSRRDIIKSCIRYIQNSTKANSVTAIEKYLNAMTKLYEECFEKQRYNNRNLFAILPFGSLKSEVKEQLRDKELKEKESYLPITESDAAKILEHLENNIYRGDIIYKRNRLLLKLILLYGFKLERIKYMVVKDIDLDRHILYIQNDIFEGISVKLELPFALVKELREYIDLLKNEPDFDYKQYLFLSRNKKIIDSSFAQAIIDNIKKESIEIGKITLTGIAKYAIINMIKEGINKANIKLITGMQDVVVDDCERCFLEQQFQEANNTIILNRDINKKIRGIEMYDKLQS